MNTWWAEKDVEGFAGPGGGRYSRLGGKVQHNLPPLI